MKNSIRLVMFMSVIWMSSSAFAQNCYMASGNNENIYEVEISTGNLVNTYSMSMDFGNISGFYGIARNPIDGEIYALIDEGSGVRSFGRVDLSLQTVFEIGSVSYIFESMQFTSDGTCYAMTASNDDTPSRFCEVNIANGSVTLLSDFDIWGGFSQALVYDEANDQMYRIEGGGGSPFGSDFYWWQTVNYSAASVVSQTTMNPGLLDSFPWTIAMSYESPGSYLVTDLNMMYSVNATGALSNPRTLSVNNPEITGIVLAVSDEPIIGCLDPMACNYNVTAELDSGDCIYTSPNDPCSECSGETDGTGSVITSPDSDNDGLCDAEEINIYGTNPFIQDTDGDGITDGAEVSVTFTDPNDPDTNDNNCNDLSESIGDCIGDVADCDSDLNADGVVNAADLLVFLTGFGTVCE